MGGLLSDAGGLLIATGLAAGSLWWFFSGVWMSFDDPKGYQQHYDRFVLWLGAGPLLTGLCILVALAANLLSLR